MRHIVFVFECSCPQCVLCSLHMRYTHQLWVNYERPRCVEPNLSFNPNSEYHLLIIRHLHHFKAFWMFTSLTGSTLTWLPALRGL